MEPSYTIHDGAPLVATYITNSNINNNNYMNNSTDSSSSKGAANYNNYLQNLLSMQKFAHAELDFLRRLVVHDGGAKPCSPSSPKRSRDSNYTLPDSIKEEEEDNKDGEEMKGRKVKSRVKKEELINIQRGRRREEEEERNGNSKKTTSKRGGGHDTSDNVKKGGKASSSPTSKLGLPSSSSHIICSTKCGPARKKVPPPPPPRTDVIHVRARRGQATDSHSLAERVRREKISEKMRFLQDLVPACSKITGKTMMLDEMINYVQSLQRQVEFLATKLASLRPDNNSNDTFMEEEIVFALAEVRGPCPDVVLQAMEQECPSYNMQMLDFPSLVNVRFCDDEDLPFISDVSTNSLI